MILLEHQIIHGVYKLICKAILSRPSTNLSKKSSRFSAAHSRISKQRPQIFQFSLSISDFKPTPNINPPRNGCRSAKSDAYSVCRYMFVDMEDRNMEIDAISLEKSVDKICMNTTAEVIVTCILAMLNKM